MLAVAEMGGIVSPPVPAFYPRPHTIGEVVDQTVGRVLDLFDLDAGTFSRWGEDIALEISPRRRTGNRPENGRVKLIGET
jgi:4-hydroxy-3-polyprenylbenzoate decarboxylase